MTESLGRLIGGTLAFSCVLAGLGGLVRDAGTAVLVVPACLLCLVPACLTFTLFNWAENRMPEERLAAFLGGTAVRLVSVLGGGLILYRSVDALRQPAFWIWVILLYLFTLLLETGLILTRTRPDSPVQ